MKKFTPVLLSFILFIFTTNISILAQFSSVKDGDWRDPLTWSSNPDATAIPDSNSTVSIQHYVTASSILYVEAVCSELIISEGGVLSNFSSAWVSGSLRVRNTLINYGTISPSYDFYISIGGNIINYGTITKNYISQYQRLNILGDIYNYGSFRFTHTNFTDNKSSEIKINHDHHIRSFNDSTIFLGETRFTDSLGTIIIDSVTILSGEIFLKGSKILLPTPILYPRYLILDNATISAGTIEANRNWIKTKEGSSAFLESIYGDVSNLHIVDSNLDGTFFIGGNRFYDYTSNINNVYFEGETTFKGNLADWYNGNIWSSGSRGILINGNFTNNGNIFNSTTFKEGLYLIQLDRSTFTSFGNINVKGIRFTGNCNFAVSDSIATDEFIAIDSNSVVKVTSGDILFKDKTVNVDFKGGTLNLPEGSSFFTSSYKYYYNTLQNININANNSKIVFSVVGQNCTMSNVIARLIWFGKNATLKGKTVVPNNGYLLPDQWTSSRILFEGDLTNYGRIEDQQNAGGTLYFDILGDIIHDGITWKNGETKLIGNQNQSINIPNDSAWTGKVVLDAMIEGTSYKWYKDNTPIDNATDRLYTLQKGISKSDYGQYYCETSAGNSRLITISGGSQEITILEQKFDSVEATKDWTVISNNSEYTWKLGNINDLNFNQIDPTNVSSAICPFVAAEQDEYIVTPAFALGEGNAKLEFYAGYNIQWLANAKLQIMLVTNNGQDWNEIWEFDATTNGWEWKKFEIDLTPYANNNNIQLAWEYIGNDGDYAAIDNVKITGFEAITDVKESNTDIIPNNFELSQNYPNPFNPSTMIKYGIPEQSNVKIEIFNMLGQSLGVLVNSEKTAGYYETTWNAANLPSGVYLISINATGLNSKNNFVQVKKALLLK